jgi:hypothetical protein
MFLLNNIYDRPYRKIYPDIDNVVFDVSDLQLANAKNQAWKAICSGSVVCVVNSSRKMSTIFRIDDNRRTDLMDSDGYQHVITGAVLAKIPGDPDMTLLLNRYKVSHPYLPRNKFSLGFNVAHLGTALDELMVEHKHTKVRLADLTRR